jgi:hypothetical protein
VDDGTASVEVVLAAKPPPPKTTRTMLLPPPPPPPPPASMPYKRIKLGVGGAAPGGDDDAETLPPLGRLVDCVGYLTPPPPEEDGDGGVGGGDDLASAVGEDGESADKDNNDAGRQHQQQEEEKGQSTDVQQQTSARSSRSRSHSRLPRLAATSIVPISDHDAESLRTLELLLSSSSSSFSPGERSSSSNGNATGIHIAGDLLSKIGAFRPRHIGTEQSNDGVDVKPPPPSTAQAQAPPYCICGATAFRLIKSAAADGGITEEDLAIALGCCSGGGGGRSSRPSAGPDAGAVAVREVVQELQLGGEIYKTRRGTYLPL